MDAARRNIALRAAGWAAAIVVIGYVGRNLADGLRKLADQPLPQHPRWGLVVSSGFLFLSAHMLLVQTWRMVLSTWKAELPFWPAARVWSVSGLGKYVPGKVWQIGALSAMSRQLGISPVVGSGAAILSTILSVITGFVVALVSGRFLLERVRPGWSTAAGVIALVSLVLLFAAPLLIPRVAPLLSRFAKRSIETTLPVRAVVYGLVGNLLAWLAYGFAFRLLVSGLLGNAPGRLADYVAAYTISYLVGYLAFFAPAGVFFREAAMITALRATNLFGASEISLITISSRVWLTLLEVIPALLFWAHHRLRQRSITPDHSDVPT